MIIYSLLAQKIKSYEVMLFLVKFFYFRDPNISWYYLWPCIQAPGFEKWTYSVENVDGALHVSNKYYNMQTLYKIYFYNKISFTI